jgi:hypothetical protein
MHSKATTATSAEKKAAEVASAYGVNGFSKIDTIRFTFNVQIGDRNIQRKWSWTPENDSVMYEGNLPTGNFAVYAYLREDLGRTAAGISEKVDRWFINDQYWLLFPLHMTWDSGLTLTLDENQPLPIPPGNASRLTVSYPAGIGYTPGDVYELFLDERNRIVQWVYRRGGSTEPTSIATWENHAKAGPLIISLEHNSRDGAIRLWFSDVAVRLKGEDRWLSANPL